MCDYLHFCFERNPNSPDSIGTSWPQYKEDQQKYLVLKPNMTIDSHLRPEFVAFWNDFIANALELTPTPCPIATTGKTLIHPLQQNMFSTSKKVV